MSLKRSIASGCLAAPAVLSFASVAAAAEWRTTVSGYANIGVAVAEQDNGGDGVGVFRDGEIHVDGELNADNGLTFGARVELEAFTTGDQIDENYGYITGSFGTIIIGGADTALNEHGGVGVLKPTGNYLNYYDDDAANSLPGDPAGFLGEDDAIGVRYYYTFKGLEFGASYQPNADTDGALDTNTPAFSDSVEDQFAFGANYKGDVGGVSFEFGGGYLTNDDEDQYHVGASVGYGGVAVAGFFNVDDNGAAPNEELYGVGALYSSGPFTFGGGYVRTEFTQGGQDEDFVHVGGGYRLAPGVTAYVAAQYGDEGADEGYGGFAWLGLKF